MMTDSSILAWRSAWIEKPVGYGPWGHKELDMTERLTFFPFKLEIITVSTVDSL